MEAFTKTLVVIPAYKPDEKLLKLLGEISSKTNYGVIVVNDGSGVRYQTIFHKAEKYATVVTYDNNHGKGYALKRALKYIKENEVENTIIVTADADGQHTAEDIIAVVDESKKHPEMLVLGCRHFIGAVPVRSNFGNRVTRQVFKTMTGTKITDTQTGLRAFSCAKLTYMINIPGNRYEYEINQLLKWTRAKHSVTEVPIDTIYLDNNKSSHFKPVSDSFHIYSNIILFPFKKVK